MAFHRNLTPPFLRRSMRAFVVRLQSSSNAPPLRCTARTTAPCSPAEQTQDVLRCVGRSPVVRARPNGATGQPHRSRTGNSWWRHETRTRPKPCWPPCVHIDPPSPTPAPPAHDGKALPQHLPRGRRRLFPSPSESGG